MSKDILIIAHFTVLPNENGNCRFNYFANLASESETTVELVTSDFSHALKKHRNISVNDLVGLKYKITLLHEQGYPKNVCLKRIRSHKKFAKELKKYLSQRETPDVVYCAVPSLDVALVAAKYCRDKGVRFIIDIQDLWPEAFQMVLHLPLISNIIFAPMKRKANKIYRSADEIIAVSDSYLRRGMSVNNKCKAPKVVYLGTDKDYFDECANKSVKSVINPDDKNADIIKSLNSDNQKIKLAYVGTLGSSYDLNTVFDALRKLNKDVSDEIQMIVMGDGPLMSDFEKNSVGLPVVFTGRLPYTQMVWILSRCDIALNPIRKGAAQSVINKHMDYAMAGLPVISTQENAEYRNLIKTYECGINCDCGDANQVAEAIKILVENSNQREEMGKNSRKMGEVLFDRKTAYKQIMELI